MDKSRLVLGRGEGADVQLTGAKISRHHAEIYRQGPIFALRDMDSTNGTFVDGVRVRHCPVRKDMLVRCGDWLGVVEEAEDQELSVEFGERLPGVYGGASLVRLSELLRRVAPSSLPIALIGETGSGKEVFARAIHAVSARVGRFYAINCATLSVELADAELFGYRRGAFTGAERHHDGHLRAASGGTLFLDEVADLSLPVQAKLLRALETGQVMALGETSMRPFETRLVSASHVPLQELSREGRFRPDLAARLEGLELRLPALRVRLGDISRLFHHFISRISGGHPPNVSTKLYESLSLYRWPGNVRELNWLAQRLLAEYPLEATILESHLPEALQFLAPREPIEGTETQPGPDESRRAHDKRRLLHALKITGGNVTQAAQKAGISRQRAYRLLDTTREQTGEDSADGAAES